MQNNILKGEMAKVARALTVKRTRGAMLASGIAGAVLIYSGVSQAFWTRQDGSYCTLALGDASKYRAGCNESTTGSAVVFCPVNDSSTQPKNSITTFNVHVDDQSPFTMIALRCVNFYAAVGGSCGASVLTNGNGLSTLKPPDFAGWNVVDFGYLNVAIPPKSAKKSCIKGYYTAG